VTPLQTFAVSTAFSQSADLNVVGDMPVNNANVACNAISFGVTIEPAPITRVLIETNGPSVRPNPCVPDAGVSDAGSDAGNVDAAAPDAAIDAARDANRG
jgi:hypothetical protein